jgi:hypothetical protein
MCIPLVARQLLGKNVTTTNMQATKEELLDTSFSMQSVLYQRKVGDQFFTNLRFLRYLCYLPIIISIDHKLMYSIQFQPYLISWTFLMMHFKAKLKSNGNKASPCSRQF